MNDDVYTQMDNRNDDTWMNDTDGMVYVDEDLRFQNGENNLKVDLFVGVAQCGKKFLDKAAIDTSFMAAPWWSQTSVDLSGSTYTQRLRTSSKRLWSPETPIPHTFSTSLKFIQVKIAAYPSVLNIQLIIPFPDSLFEVRGVCKQMQGMYARCRVTSLDVPFITPQAFVKLIVRVLLTLVFFSLAWWQMDHAKQVSSAPRLSMELFEEVLKHKDTLSLRGFGHTASGLHDRHFEPRSQSLRMFVKWRRGTVQSTTWNFVAIQSGSDIVTACKKY
ncbi:uncharacterized protein LACBIDRAFT_322064 [Laccaria bicolor S238N-H82]|uniref:Predicted protein n=1 Tax=Laccaria bicolor (strain S238N-H82 / ATCC MYA-4686) TaxID=486041 RepID=B0CS03_LACBS|nr:uncharacterized protein LACBIDRAFT_322064 [Laccaria bicolor S238N-H82]EDR14210.1 predicted protein [Laccaria bicolor S238N-H82]|eukprot:XP_001874769.1 predicted protein [Laccaria bicolor S238N-H82]